MAHRPTSLEFAILGLVRNGTLTGYAISQVFASTPMAHYSPSPGSIYPALKRLQRAGLLDAIAHPDSPATSKKALRITAAGQSALLAWLTSPVSRCDVEHRMEEMFLRLAFMSDAVPIEEIGRYLATLETELRAHADRLTVYGEQALAHMPLGASLAFAAGLTRVRAYAAWARQAIETIDGCTGG